MRAEICRLVDKLETSVHADMSEPAVYQVEGGCGMHCRQCRRCSVPSGGQCEHNVEMVLVTNAVSAHELGREGERHKVMKKVAPVGGVLGGPSVSNSGQGE